MSPAQYQTREACDKRMSGSETSYLTCRKMSLSRLMPLSHLLPPPPHRIITTWRAFLPLRPVDRRSSLPTDCKEPLPSSLTNGWTTPYKWKGLRRGFRNLYLHRGDYKILTRAVKVKKKRRTRSLLLIIL